MKNEHDSRVRGLGNNLLTGALAASMLTAGYTPSEPEPTNEFIVTPAPITSIEPSSKIYKSLAPLETQIISPAETEGISSKPNIVVIMIDDVNPVDGRLWSKDILPTIHATFVEEGIEYANFHAETPLCCPARVGVLTGQHTQNHGVLDNSKFVKNFDDSETIATALDEEGYFTIIVGKGLNDMRSLKDPDFDGFDRQAIIFESNGKYYDYDLLLDGKKIKHYGKKPSDYSTDVISDMAVKSIQDAPNDAPIFALITPYAAHGWPPIPAPRHKNDDRCDVIKPWEIEGSDETYDLEDVCRSLLAVDDLTKAVIEELTKQGRLDNTILVFTADNGMAWSIPGAFSKANAHSVDIPLYIRWPAGRGTEPDINNVILSNIDLAPTLVEAGGGELGPYPNGQQTPDGISFYKSIIDTSVSTNIENEREFILLQEPTDYHTKSAWWGLKTTEASNLGTYYYVIHKNGDQELFNYAQDPYNLTNIASDPKNKDVIKILAQNLNELRKPFKDAS